MLGMNRWLITGMVIFSGSSLCVSRQTRERPATADNRVEIVGVWRGHSICEDRSSPCHDEINVYRFSSVAQRPDAFFGTASKVVDGKEIVMGTGEWKYDSGKHVLETQNPAIRMTVDGDKLEGALTLSNGAIYRRIYLKKES
jgi:hypothetical protein